MAAAMIFGNVGDTNPFFRSNPSGWPTLPVQISLMGIEQKPLVDFLKQLPYSLVSEPLVKDVVINASLHIECIRVGHPPPVTVQQKSRCAAW